MLWSRWKWQACADLTCTSTAVISQQRWTLSVGPERNLHSPTA